MSEEPGEPTIPAVLPPKPMSPGDVEGPAMAAGGGMGKRAVTEVDGLGCGNAAKAVPPVAMDEVMAPVALANNVEVPGAEDAAAAAAAMARVGFFGGNGAF